VILFPKRGLDYLNDLFAWQELKESIAARLGHLLQVSQQALGFCFVTHRVGGCISWWQMTAG
jgi:hypothetical protein